MSLNRRSRAASLCAALCIRVSAASMIALAPACSLMMNTGGSTSVAAGKLYEPGEADYDAFFKDLYEIQLLMGQAPERESGARARVAKALDLPEGSTNEAIGDGVYERAALLAKAGVMLKMSLSGMEEGGSPAATVVTIGDVKADKDKSLVLALETAAKEDAELLASLRKTKKPLDKMRGTGAALETRVDRAFAATSKAKKDEVRANLEDARQLIPLMSSRGDEVQQQTAHFLTSLQKVLGAPTSASGPTEPAEPAKKPAKAAAKPKATPASKPVSKPETPPRAVPKAEPKEPPPPAAKKAPVEVKKTKAPAEDFEP